MTVPSKPFSDDPFTDYQLQQFAVEAGWPKPLIPTLGRIIKAESDGLQFALNQKGDDDSYGLTQINMLDDPGDVTKGISPYLLGTERRDRYNLESNEDLYDPVTNLRIAYDIYKRKGNTFNDWSTFTETKAPRYYKNFQWNPQNPNDNRDKAVGLSEKWKGKGPMSIPVIPFEE